MDTIKIAQKILSSFTRTTNFAIIEKKEKIYAVAYPVLKSVKNTIYRCKFALQYETERSLSSQLKKIIKSDIDFYIL